MENGQYRELLMLDMLSMVYEDMDVDAIEEKFMNFVSEIFSFDRLGLFFVKHRKGMLQGKLCKGFAPGSISSLEIPVAEKYLFTRPLVTGLPIWDLGPEADPFALEMGLDKFAIIPIVSQKRISCWQIKKCESTDCPAYGNKWLRCWLASDTKCCDSGESLGRDKLRMCEACPVFSAKDPGAVEGILLVDNSLTKRSIDRNMITSLSIISHAVGVAINNSKAYSSAMREAIIDDLTGLHNRRYFNERLLDEVERAKRYGNAISMLYCDIDNFKNINDRFGHPAGDAVLVRTGNIFRDNIRQTDLVARYGGEEFAVLLLNTEKDKAVKIAENLRGLVARSALPEDNDARVTISVGVSTLGVGVNSFKGLIDKADKALYQAKSLGRNRVCAA